MNLNGKTCLITHAESDIGRITAIELAKLGAHVVMLSHDEQEGIEAKTEIFEKSHSKLIDLIYMNPNSLKNVHEFADNFRNKYKQLDILINNDHYITGKRRTTDDGNEANFAFNFLNNYLLSGLLLDLLNNSESARIINTGSEIDGINFSDIQSENNFRSIIAGSHVSRLNYFYSYKLSHLLKGTKITVNCARQGALADDNDYEGFEKMTVIAKKNLQKLLTVDKRGANDIIYLATSDEVQNISGKLFCNKKETHIIASTSTAHNVINLNDDEKLEKAEKVWEIAEKLTGYKYENSFLYRDEFEEIQKFKTLLDQGIINQEEFDKKKKELLNL